MSKEITATTYDYSGVDKDTKNKLLNLAGHFNSQMKSYKKSWLDLGEIVSQAHELLAGDGKDGRFGPWIEASLKCSRSTAYRYMWAWERFGKCSSVEHFTTEALYDLSGPNVPEKAVNDAIKRADKGQPVTKVVSGELIEKHTVESKAKASKAPYVDPIEAACDHDFDDEACRKCHAPKPVESKKKISGGTTFDREELDSESKDAFGQEPPDELRKVFELCDGFDEQRAKLSSIKKWMTVHCSSNHPGAAVMQSAAQRIRSDIDQADAELLFCRPYCVCVYCHNKDPKVANCNACKGLGWITEKVYEAAPKGMKREKVKA